MSTSGQFCTLSDNEQVIDMNSLRSLDVQNACFFVIIVSMKNERAIEELLSEMLRKQDQQTELLSRMVVSDEKQNKILENHTGILSKLVDGQNTIVEKMNESTANTEHNFKLIITELKALRDELQRMDDFERRLQLLESKVG